jgi:lipid II:glycine glycyltransferase (peptidoglycan interpeptide bridge formation enzyme)
LWIGGVNARKDLSTNEFLTWEIIQHAKSEGFKALEVMGAHDPPRLTSFKSKFDPVLEPYCSVDKADALLKIESFVYRKLNKKGVLDRILPRPL